LVFYSKYYFGDDTIKESAMGGECGMYGGKGKCIEIGGGT